MKRRPEPELAWRPHLEGGAGAHDWMGGWECVTDGVVVYEPWQAADHRAQAHSPTGDVAPDQLQLF